MFENLKKYYGAQGFIEYTAEPTPTFKDNPQNPNEGIVDFIITIEEGKQFTLRRLEFIGNTFTRDNVLRREVLLNEGDIYNQTLLGIFDHQTQPARLLRSDRQRQRRRFPAPTKKKRRLISI